MRCGSPSETHSSMTSPLRVHDPHGRAREGLARGRVDLLRVHPGAVVDHLDPRHGDALDDLESNVGGDEVALGRELLVERVGAREQRELVGLLAGDPLLHKLAVRVVGAQRRPGQLALPGELDHLAVLLDGERDLGVGAEVSLGRLRLAHEVVAVGQGVGRGLRGTAPVSSVSATSPSATSSPPTSTGFADAFTTSKTAPAPRAARGRKARGGQAGRARGHKEGP